MSDLVKIARQRVDDSARTHWEGCERDHRECLIQRMADEIERLREYNDTLVRERNAAWAEMNELRAEIEALRAEVEQLKSDKLELARDMISIAHTDDEMEIVLDEQPIKVKFDFDAGEPQWFDARAGVGSPGYPAYVEVYEIDFLDGKGWTQADQWPDQLDIERIEQLVMDCISDRNEYDADEYVEQLRESAMLADKWKR